MESFFIDNYIINSEPIEILTKLQSQLTNGKLKSFKQSSSYIQVPCPCHANGQEKHYSCFINIDSAKAPYLCWHCFTCGSRGSLIEFISKCFDCSIGEAKRWLITNFGTQVQSSIPIFLEKIDLTPRYIHKEYLDESILDQYESWCPYLEQRKISPEVAKQFDVKYDPSNRSVVFPVRDKSGKLAYLTRRFIDKKKFIIDKGASKSDIYLLYNVIQNNIKEIFVCESQIDALTVESYGKHAIALFGAGTTEEQMKELNKTEIRRYILAYDNDEAGRKGLSRFRKYIKKGVFVDNFPFPEGKKDINELSREEFGRITKDLNCIVY